MTSLRGESASAVVHASLPYVDRHMEEGAVAQQVQALIRAEMDREAPPSRDVLDPRLPSIPQLRCVQVGGALSCATWGPSPGVNVCSCVCVCVCSCVCVCVCRVMQCRSRPSSRRCGSGPLERKPLK